LTKTLATLASQLVAGPTGTVQKGAPVGGLLGVQAHLGNLLASRDKALPAVLREEKPR